MIQADKAAAFLALHQREEAFIIPKSVGRRIGTPLGGHGLRGFGDD